MLSSSNFVGHEILCKWNRCTCFFFFFHKGWFTEPGAFSIKSTLDSVFHHGLHVTAEPGGVTSGMGRALCTVSLPSQHGVVVMLTQICSRMGRWEDEWSWMIPKLHDSCASWDPFSLNADNARYYTCCLLLDLFRKNKTKKKHGKFFKVEII